MTSDRHLDWDGCFNVRDLGGLHAANSRKTYWGAVVRADAPDRLTPGGWSALLAHGIRTIIDLRNDDERHGTTEPPSGDLTTIHVPLDDVADTEFWKYLWDNELDGSPLYYQPFLDRKPQRCAAVVAAVGHARPGGVLIHCGIGRDRTGLVALLLLALVGVTPDDIASDYQLSAERLPSLFAALGKDDQGPLINGILTRKGISAREAILSTLASLDAEAYLRAAGLNDDDLTAVRARLLRPSMPGRRRS